MNIRTYLTATSLAALLNGCSPEQVEQRTLFPSYNAGKEVAQAPVVPEESRTRVYMRMSMPIKDIQDFDFQTYKVGQNGIAVVEHGSQGSVYTTAPELQAQPVAPVPCVKKAVPRKAAAAKPQCAKP